MWSCTASHISSGLPSIWGPEAWNDVRIHAVGLMLTDSFRPLFLPVVGIKQQNRNEQVRSDHRCLKYFFLKIQKNKSFLKRFRLKSWTYFLAEMAAHLSFMGHVCTSRRILIDSRWSVPTAWTAPRSGSHLICRDHTNISPFFLSSKLIRSISFKKNRIK